MEAEPTLLGEYEPPGTWGMGSNLVVTVCKKLPPIRNAKRAPQ